MIVTWSNFKEIVAKLSLPGERSVDTETTGLRVHHEDRLFSIIFTDDEDSYYFNFQKYADVDEESTLDRSLLALLKPVFGNPLSRWFAHKANFDQHVLAREGLFIAGEIHCTKAVALLEYNEHQSYDLAACAERIGEKKDDAVEDYIAKHKLYTKIAVRGKAKKVVRKHFDLVPFSLIAPYGCTDARVTKRLGHHQKEFIRKLSDETPAGLPKLDQVFANEKRLTKTIFRMEQRGLRADLSFCARAADFEQSRMASATSEFTKLTGKEFKNSPKLFQEVFADQHEKWIKTETGAWSFDKEVIASFDSPVAKQVQTLRDAKAKADFYYGFIYHADKNGFIHPTLNQDGAGHGRTSSSDPNMQNLKKDKEKAVADEEFVVRRAIIPPDGKILFSLDHDQMEYRFLMDRADEMGIIRLIREEGMDPHTATGKNAGVDRDDAKRVNFGLIYGQGLDLLAANLKVSKARAREIREAVLGGMPNVEQYMYGIMDTAANRGYIFNWLGRRCYFPEPRFAYRALNYAVAGGCADVMKVGMNRIDDFLEGRKSSLIWNVHDENLLAMDPSELHLLPEIREIMETAYPHKHIKLTAGISYSEKSWADLDDWRGESSESCGRGSQEQGMVLGVGQ
jgi:DNA polymerase-1